MIGIEKCQSLFEKLIGKNNENDNTTLTLRVNNMRVCGKSIAELEALLNRQCKVVSVLQNKDVVMRLATDDMIICAGDQLLVKLDQHDVVAMQALVGERL